jgi:hypothetical protein
MKRIESATRQLNLFGTSRDGFTGGTAPAIPPTHLSSSWCNNVQEAIARSVEGSGQTVVAAAGDDNYFQLDNAIQGMSRCSVANSTSDFILSGLTFSVSPISLTATLNAGEMVVDGRRYVITAAKLTASSVAIWSSLTVSRDHYFYAAPENPGALATPPNRETVYATRLDVANGASAPATPAGTFLFARLVTNGSGVTSAVYYNRGSRLGDEAGTCVVLRPATGDNLTIASFHPFPSTEVVDLGYHTVDSVEGRYGVVYCQELDIGGVSASLYSAYSSKRYAAFSVTAAGGTATVVLASDAAYADGTIAYYSARGGAFSLGTASNGYAFRLEGMALKSGGSWSLEGSGLAPAFADGNAAVANGVTITGQVSGDNLRLLLTGHTVDAMRWEFEIHLMIIGD